MSTCCSSVAIESESMEARTRRRRKRLILSQYRNSGCLDNEQPVMASSACYKRPLLGTMVLVEIYEREKNEAVPEREARLSLNLVNEAVELYLYSLVEFLKYSTRVHREQFRPRKKLKRHKGLKRLPLPFSFVASIGW